MTDDKSSNTDGEQLPGERAGRIKTTPTLRPTLVWLGLVVSVGLVSVLYLTLRRETFANPETANILIQAIAILTLIGVVRFLVRLYILKRTRYVVDPDTVTRKYDLLFRSRRREVPFSMVRSHELRQSRIQKLLGYGTIVLNEGLGPIELENVPEPRQFYRAIQSNAKDKHE